MNRGATLKGDSSTAEATALQVGIIKGVSAFLDMEVEDEEEPKRSTAS